MSVYPMEHDGIPDLHDPLLPSSTREEAPAFSATNRPGGNRQTDTNRILCPVEGCLEASPSSHKKFHTFANIKNHLDAHCTGYLSGAIPA